MKKLGIILMVLSFFMTMTQCKKNLQVIPSINNDEEFISLNVNDGSKVNVNTADGKVIFEKDDVLYVASDGKYVGILTYNGEVFEGSITGAIVDEPLCFYFLGNQTVDKLVEGKTSSCTVLISDQSKKLPVISFGESREAFNGAGNYSAFLYNQCALMKFNVVSASDKSVCLTGMNNRVTVFFSNKTFKYDKEGEGIIKLSEGSGEKWAIVLPQRDMKVGDAGSLFTEDEKYVGTRPSMPVIECNDFFDKAIELALDEKVLNDGAFTASRARKVTFSKGNLQYVHDGSKCSWKFADNQYDVIGMGQNGTDSQDISRDLYGWGTGDNPCNVSDKDGDYSTFVDWGAVIGKRDGASWRTLSCTEWDYIINRRKASTVNGIENARYTKAVVNGINGMILFPDVYTHPSGVELPEAINYTTSNQSWDVNVYTAEEWVLIENEGAIFLPAAGERRGTSVTNVGVQGRYWSSYTEDSNHAFDLYFSDYRPYPNDVDGRSDGFSVRLVHE